MNSAGMDARRDSEAVALLILHLVPGTQQLHEE